MQLLFAPFLLFVALPPLALLPAGLLLHLWRSARSRRPPGRSRSFLVAGVLWAVYAAYESVVWIWSRDVVAPIRVDLLLIAPILYVASAFAFASWWKERQQASRSTP